MLRVGPPRDPDERRRGWLVSPVYTIMEANGMKGQVSVSFPKRFPSRAQVHRKRPSGRLIEVLTVYSARVGGEILVGGFEGHEALQPESTIVDLILSHFAKSVRFHGMAPEGIADSES